MEWFFVAVTAQVTARLFTQRPAVEEPEQREAVPRGGFNTYGGTCTLPEGWAVRGSGDALSAASHFAPKMRQDAKPHSFPAPSPSPFL